MLKFVSILAIVTLWGTWATAQPEQKGPDQLLPKMTPQETAQETQKILEREQQVELTVVGKVVSIVLPNKTKEIPGQILIELESGHQAFFILKPTTMIYGEDLNNETAEKIKRRQKVKIFYVFSSNKILEADAIQLLKK